MMTFHPIRYRLSTSALSEHAGRTPGGRFRSSQGELMSRISKVAAVMAGTGALIAGGAGMATADSGAEAVAAHSPGVLSGNAVQVPVHIPVNVCGNTVNVIALLNPAFGNTCANVSDHQEAKADEYGYGH